MLNQVQKVCFSSEDGKCTTYVDTDTALGNFHDYLMMLKGYTVDKMVQAQKEEQEITDAQKKESEG